MRIWTQGKSSAEISVLERPLAAAKWLDERRWGRAIRRVVILVADGDVWRRCSLQVRSLTPGGGVGVTDEGDVVDFLDTQVINFVSVRPSYLISEELVS